jgi:MFS family permease
LWGFGAALLSGTDQALIYDTLRKLDRTEDMKKIMARKQSMMLIGILISAPIGSMLALMLPLNVIMQLMFVPFIIATCLAFTFKEPNEDLVRTESENYIQVIKSGFQELKNSKVLRVLAVDAIIGDILAFFLIWMYQIYLENLGIALFFFGFIAAGMTISQISLTSLTPEIEQKFKNKKRFLQVYTILPGIGFILMAVVKLPILGILLILMTIGFGMSRKFIFTNAINNVIESENRATVLSTISMFECLIRGAVFPLIGILVMINLDIAFIILGLGLITLALTTRVRNEHLT